jgi:hypothetical protein
MANRYFSQFQLSLEKQVAHLFGRMTIGASGAPTLDVSNSKGIASITRSASGKYVITLSDTYNRFLGINATRITASASSAPSMYVVSEQVGTAGAPQITVQFNSAGTAADPASGEDIRFHIILKNSAV